MKTRAELLEPLKSLLDKEIGKYQLKSAFVDHNASFESAAWWENTQVELGIYPIIIAENPYQHGDPACLRINFHGKVVEDYFPSLFGGVAFGKYGSKHVGEERKVYRDIRFDTAIQRTGASPEPEGSKSSDIWINPDIWEAVADYLKLRLQSNLETLQYFQKRWEENPGEQTASSLHSAGRWIADASNTYATILRCIKHHQNRTTTAQGWYDANTAWTRECDRQIA